MFFLSNNLHILFSEKYISIGIETITRIKRMIYVSTTIFFILIILTGLACAHTRPVNTIASPNQFFYFYCMQIRKDF